MVFPVVGGNKSKGYDVENSLRFDSGSSPDLTRTFSNNSNKRTWTWSGWFKNCIGTHEVTLLRYSPDDDTIDNIVLSTSGNIQFQIRRAPTNHAYLNTNQLLRDPAAWYHLVVVLDTTQSTDSNRVKFYLNGNQITSFASATYPSQNHEGAINSNVEHTICKFRETGGDGTRYGDFYLAENHFIDGTAKAQTDFGEFDDNGVWIPKKYTGTYGSNGYYLEFKQTGTSANSSGIGADTSGNDNHFTPTNLAALDITEDTCTNNFATFSPLGRVTGTVTLSEGNCKIEGSSDANASGQHGTIAFTSGKWYLEMKATDSTTTQLGFLTVNSSARGDNTPDGNGGMNYHYANIYYQYNNSSVNKVDTGGGGISAASVSGGSNSSLGGFSDGDILMFALDMDNNRAYFGKNGTWFNSGNPANGTNYFSLQTDVADGVTFYAGVDNCTGTELNTGNPSFSISSGNNDGKYGNFEYEVPSGYYAMCTKRLAEFG